MFILPSFSNFLFFHLSLLCNVYGDLLPKISQHLLDEGLSNLVQGLGMIVLCNNEKAKYCLSVSLFVNFSFFPIEVFHYISSVSMSA